MRSVGAGDEEAGDVGTFEDEWAQIKRDRSGGDRMHLAGVDGEASGGGAGGGRLKSEKAAWSHAARGVASLRGDVTKALTSLEDGQEGLGAGSGTGGEGVVSAAAQRGLYRSWHRYLQDVSGRCGSLQGKLEKAGSDHAENDHSVTASFSGLDHYKDTDAVGGEQGGRG